MKKTLLDKIKYEFEGLKFLIRNLKASHHLSSMQTTAYNNYLLTGLTKNRINELDQLHRTVRDGRGLNFWRKLFYRYRGTSVCGTVINKKNQLVGFNYYYFRNNESEEKIIHEAFLGIAPQERGKGIATALQKYTLEQLSRQPLTGVSGYVEKTNLASIKMLQRVGYDFDDDPRDPENNFKVYYPLI